MGGKLLLLPGEVLQTASKGKKNLNAAVTTNCKKSAEAIVPCVFFFSLTSGFLQIPPHGRHPCLRLTLPTAERVVDLHHRAVVHAGHTAKNPAPVETDAGSIALFYFKKRSS